MKRFLVLLLAAGVASAQVVPPPATRLTDVACRLDGGAGCSSGGGSGDVESVNITTTSPLTGGTTCATGACSFTLGLTGGTLSGLTSTRIPVATSATAVADSAITHDSTTGVTTFGGSAPKLELTEGSVSPAGGGILALDGDAFVSIRINGSQLGYFDGNGLLISGLADARLASNRLATSIEQYGYSSKALVDATATAFMLAHMTSGQYSGGTVDYAIIARDGTDTQVRAGSIPFAARDAAGTSSCVFGTASDAYDGSSGTLTVTWDCIDGTDGALLRVTADTSLASTTSFVIQSRLSLPSRALPGAVPQ